jgi:hydrogenase 3 maturation protease
VTNVSVQDFGAQLRRRLQRADRVAVVGIGDECMPHDRLGMLAAREIEQLQLRSIRVFFAGTVPESVTGPIREYQPDHVLLIDAADIGAPPGTVEIIKPGRIQARLFSTHVLPLSVVMEFIAKDAHTKVTFIGIQPDMHLQGERPSDREREGVELLSETFGHIFG